MEFNEYQRRCADSDRSPGKDWYYGLGLTGESGEVVELIKKANRTGEWRIPVEGKRLDSMLLELGDVLWYIARLGDVYGFTLQQIAEANIEKLRDRMTRAEGPNYAKHATNLPDRVPA
jgi:NTP pyrophosphatase (non-canonical NTP hydrolase)